MDKLNLGGKLFDSRFIMGSGKFDPELISACIDEAKTQIITLAIRRVNQDQNASITKFIPKNITLLPN
ncbi:MAG: thiazole synthase, partial [Campylobacter sp.]|nr:thiazole synthase [Campylobacter sp.]